MSAMAEVPFSNVLLKRWRRSSESKLKVGGQATTSLEDNHSLSGQVDKHSLSTSINKYATLS